MVEVIIVLAITVVVSGMFFIGISFVNSKPVDECAQKLQIALENNRVTTMGKLNASICITKDAKGYIVVKETVDGNIRETRVGEQSVTVGYTIEGETTEKSLPSGGLVISFNRGSGSLNKLNMPGSADDGKYVSMINISRGEKKLNVKIDKITGRISVE